MPRALVDPFFCTSRQLDLVGCRFKELHAASTVCAGESNSHQPDDDDQICIASTLLGISPDALDRSFEAPGLVNILDYEGSLLQRLG